MECPQISGFGLNASTPRMATKANRQAHSRSRQLCRPSAFESEANRPTRQDAYTHSSLACGGRIRALQLPPITFGSREIAGSSSWSPASIRRSRCYLGGPAMMPD